MQRGLQTTSVCVTNHSERAGLQPTQLNTCTWEQTKAHSHGCKCTRSPLMTTLGMLTITWQTLRKTRVLSCSLHMRSVSAEHLFMRLYDVLWSSKGKKKIIATFCISIWSNTIRLLSSFITAFMQTCLFFWAKDLSFCKILLSLARPTEGA